MSLRDVEALGVSYGLLKPAATSKGNQVLLSSGSHTAEYCLPSYSKLSSSQYINMKYCTPVSSLPELGGAYTNSIWLTDVSRLSVTVISSGTNAAAPPFAHCSKHRHVYHTQAHPLQQRRNEDT